MNKERSWINNIYCINRHGMQTFSWDIKILKTYVFVQGIKVLVFITGEGMHNVGAG